MSDIGANDTTEFPYFKIKNWKGNLSQSCHLSEWQEKYKIGERELHQQFFFFRRESKALIELYVFKFENKFLIGFRQEDGRGIKSDEKYNDIEVAKQKSIEFFIDNFFKNTLISLEKMKNK